MRHALICSLALASAGCTNGLVDYAVTGVAIAPGPGSWSAPQKLTVVNRTGKTLTCQVTQHAGCPSVAGIEGLASLDPGERWKAEGVKCALIDVACMDDDAQASTQPAIRTWSWEILPPQDTAMPTPKPTP